MKISWVISAAVVVLTLVLAVYAYNVIPGDKIASHWDFRGNVDGYSSKSCGLLVFPIMSVVLFVLFLILPRIDPYRENWKKFRKEYEIFVVLLMAFFLYIYFLTISWNLGYSLSFIKWMSPALAVLLFYSGIMTSRTRRNWFVGIRTPWTLSSDRVWNKTNRLGGVLLQILGVVSLFGFYFANYLWTFMIILIVAMVGVLFYSYVLYLKEKKR